jgi:hypothetical protein
MVAGHAEAVDHAEDNLTTIKIFFEHIS